MRTFNLSSRVPIVFLGDCQRTHAGFVFQQRRALQPSLHTERRSFSLSGQATLLNGWTMISLHKCSVMKELNTAGAFAGPHPALDHGLGIG